MKTFKLTFLALALLVLPLAIDVSAQDRSGSEKWTNDQAVDFVTCSFVKVSLKSSRDCTDASSLDILRKEIDANGIKATSDLATALDGLKKNENVKDAEPVDVFEYLSKTLFMYGSEPSRVGQFLMSPNRKPGDVNDLREAIEKGLRDNFLPSDSAVASNQKTAGDSGSEGAGTDANSDLTSDDYEDATDWSLGFGSTYLVLLIVLIIAVGIGLFAFYSIKVRGSGNESIMSKGDRRTESRSNATASSAAPSQPVGTLSSSKIGIRSDIKVKELEARVLELEKKLAAKDAEIEALKTKVPQPEVSSDYAVIPADYQQPTTAFPPPAQSSNRSIYFPAPTPDGLFVSRYSSPTKIEGESLYILKLSSESEAEVHFDNTRLSINKAKNSPEQILDPVCEGIRDPMNQISGIRMISPGKARLEGDDWRVYEKVKLTYEY
jgi:hypothetical protein